MPNNYVVGHFTHPVPLLKPKVIVNLLLLKGADIIVADEDGRTPPLVASKRTRRGREAAP